jgi:hypothetical protein
MQARADRYARLPVSGLQIVVFEACLCLGRGLATVEQSDERAVQQKWSALVAAEQLFVESVGPS